uniref:Peptidase_M24 domain-containing protein n=1 Tax=Loa loa TaxID=7209 RepID=A0A1I7W1N8_LOALO
MMKARMGAVFMPHGLGHLMGLDVHDCGGYLGDAELRSTLPGLKALRTTRTLRERMVITIEPGCYFIDTVRIEDDIVIWSHGNERMSNVPRTVDEIDSFMSSSCSE